MIDAMRATAALLMIILLAGAARADGDAARGEARCQRASVFSIIAGESAFKS